MSRLKKFVPAAVVILIGVVLAASLWPGRGNVPVEVSRVQRKDLVSTVRATGEFIPTRYVNVLGQGYGRITEILVHEGESVRPGDLLMQVDPVQPAAAVRAQQATVASARSGLRVAESALQSAQARLVQQEAALEKADFDWQREQKLYEAGVISQKAAESYRTTLADAQASVAAARAQVVVARDEQTRAAGQLDQAQAVLVHDEDVLSKTTYRATMAGTVTNIAVRVGENVIPGVPQSAGAYLMTISDMSAAIAQVRVDQNDVAYLHRGQAANVSIGAYPGQTFSGHVEQVGVQAIEANSGMATSQTIGSSSGQQVTHYQVRISVSHPPKGLLPGMAVTSVIQTTNKKGVIAVPFQALVLRPKDEAGRTSLPATPPAATVQIAARPAPKDQQANGEQGVFVVRSGRAIFAPVKIGVLGESDVEALSGVQPGAEIVVGDFTALETLHSGRQVRVVKSGQ